MAGTDPTLGDASRCFHAPYGISPTEYSSARRPPLRHSHAMFPRRYLLLDLRATDDTDRITHALAQHQA